jgi:hypothetical protein
LTESSPDINPIENLWGLLVKKIEQQRLVFHNRNVDPYNRNKETANLRKKHLLTSLQIAIELHYHYIVLLKMGIWKQPNYQSSAIFVTFYQRQIVIYLTYAGREISHVSTFLLTKRKWKQSNY